MPLAPPGAAEVTDQLVTELLGHLDALGERLDTIEGRLDSIAGQQLAVGAIAAQLAQLAPKVAEVLDSRPARVLRAWTEPPARHRR